MCDLILVLLLNLPNGEQIEQSRIRMDAVSCLIMQEAVWNGPNEVAYIDEFGPAPIIDAACIPVTD